jgi:hypothetical protein
MLLRLPTIAKYSTTTARTARTGMIQGLRLKDIDTHRC